MPTVNLRDAKAGFSGLVDEAIKGEFVTITRHGKPVAVLVSVEAAEIARKVLERTLPAPATYPEAFPRPEAERRRAPSRGMAEEQPVFITEQGKPAQVLLSIGEYQRLTHRRRSIVDALAMPGIADIDVEFPRSRDLPRPADFG